MGEDGAPDFHLVRVGGADVLVARLPDGRPVAFSAECPHQATPLEGATFWDGRLRCARHLYLYDVDTGENVLPARDATPEALVRLKPGYLPVYRTEERDGWIWVAEGPEPPPEAPQGAPGRSAPAAAAPAGPADDGPVTLVLRVGEEAEVALVTTPKPAHLWRSAVAGEAAAVVSGALDPGPPPRHLVRLVGLAPGRAEVRFTYAAPWGGEPADTRTVTVVVAP